MHITPDRINVERLIEFEHFLDVRSPSEYTLDHIPGATNCPVLDDHERARVGTVFKQESPFLAKKLGAAMVARNIASHLESRFLSMPREWRPLIYCWRGGKRSGAMTHILREVGWDARQLEGGYRAYRRHIVSDMSAQVQRLRFRVICGLTGSGKSRLLSALAEQGEQVLDLEGMAAHKGSVLGSDPVQPQPTQKYFESRLWDCLRKADAARWVYVESESKKVGTVQLPEALIRNMWNAQCLWLSAPQQSRVALLKAEYDHFVQNPEALVEKLLCLRPLHGSDVIERWVRQAKQHSFDTLVGDLLERHYDPAYTKSIRSHYVHLERALQCDLAGTTTEDFRQLAVTLQAST